MSNLSTLPKGDSAWLLRKALERIMEQVSVLETNIGSSTTGNSANTQIIFNDNGTLRGDAGLVYNKTTDALTVAGLVTAGSATITGDLTVDTNVLKVDSVNNRVGINTNPGSGTTLHIIDSDPTILLQGNQLSGTRYNRIRFANQPGSFNEEIYGGYFGTGGLYIADYSNTGILFGVSNTPGTFTERYRIASDGIATWSNVGGVAGTAMTLDATGLGVGVTPSAWGNASKVVQVGQAGCIYGRAAFGYYGTKFNLYNDNTNDIAITSNFVGEYRFEIANGSHVWLNKSTAGTINTNQTLTQAMTLDASGNLMVGTTGASSLIGGSGAITAKGLAGILSVNVTALATDFTLPIGAFAGILTIRSNGSGGSAVFMLDPNVGAVSIANNIVGRTITLTFSSGSWKLQQTAGTVPSTYNYLVLSTQ